MKLKNLILPILTVCILAAAAILPAQKLAVPEHVPADVQNIISINDADKLWKGLGQSPLRKKIQAFLALPVVNSTPGYQDLLLFMDKAALDLGYGLEPDKFLGPVLRGVDLYNTGKDGFVIVAKFAEPAQATAFESYLNTRFREKAEEAKLAGLPTIAIQEYSIAGITVHGVAAADVHYGVKNNILFVASTQPALQSAIESPGAERLKENPQITKAASALEANGQLFFMINGDQLESLAETVPNSPLAGQNIQLGMTAGYINFKPDRININYTTFGAATSAGESGDISAVLRHAGPNPILGVATASLDPAFFSDFDDSAAGAALPALSTVTDRMNTFETETGLSLENDFAAAFGNSAGFFINDLNLAGIGNMSADLTVVVSVKDEAKAREVMAKVEKEFHQYAVEQLRNYGMNAQTVQPVEETHEGTTIRSVPYKNPMLNAPMGLSYAFTNGQMLAGLSAESVKAALSRAKSNSFAAGTDFTQAKQALPASFDSLFMIDLNRIGAIAENFVGILVSINQGDAQQAVAASAALGVIKSLGSIYCVSSRRDAATVNHATILMKQ